MIYTRNTRTIVTGSGAAVWELIAGLKDLRLLEIGINIVNATASQFSLGRPAAAGIVPTTPVNLMNGASLTDVSKGAVAVAWGTPPTAPTSFFRQANLPAAVGAEKIWSFSPMMQGQDQWTRLGGKIYVPAGSSIVIWTTSTVSVADVYAIIEE